MNIFNHLVKVTGELDTIEEIVCPEMRPVVYYLDKVFDRRKRINLNNLDNIRSRISIELTTFFNAVNEIEKTEKNAIRK